MGEYNFTLSDGRKTGASCIERKERKDLTRRGMCGIILDWR